MNRNKFWMWYNILMVAFLLIAAYSVAPSDLWVRIDGWLAIVNAICAVKWWSEIERSSTNAND